MTTRTPTLDDRARRLLPLTPAVLQILLSLSSEDRHGLGLAPDLQEVPQGRAVPAPRPPSGPAAATRGFPQGRPVLGPGTLYGTIRRVLDAALLEDLASPGGDDDDPR